MATLNTTYTFTNGNVAEAGQVNTNFNDVENWVSTNVVQIDGSVQAPSIAIANGAITSDKILNGTIMDIDINASAGIADTKLATIATAGKVSNSATTATSGNTASAIVARDASGNFTAGTITATTFVGTFSGTSSGNLTSGGPLGTPSSGTLTNCTFPTLNQNTTGNAATATNVAYSGLTGAVPTWNQNTTGNAETATTATTARGLSAASYANNITIGSPSYVGSFGVGNVNIYTPSDGDGDIRIDSGQNLYLDSGNGSNESVLLQRGGSTVINIYDQTATGPKVNGSFYGSGNLGSGSARWGAVYATNGTIQTSDARLKTDITDSPLGLDFIEKLRPVNYKWVDGGPIFNPNPTSDDDIILGNTEGKRLHYGLIAQEVKQAVDESGVEDFGGWVLEKLDDPESDQALNYGEFIAPLIKAVQELSSKVNTLEARLAALEAK
jgi:hypothetical protein